MAECVIREDRRHNDPATDQALLLAFHRGHEIAARDLWDRHAGRLRAYARSIAGSHQADDIVQMVFLRVLAQRRGVVRRVSDPAAWLCTLTRNAALNARRQERRTTRRERAAEARQHGTSAGTIEIDAMLEGVPGPLREALVLRHAYGFSLERLADALGVSRSTAADRYAKGLRCARERLNADRNAEHNAHRNTGHNAGQSEGVPVDAR